MRFTKIRAFSPDNKYFACFSSDDKLLIWETLTADFIDCKYDSCIHSTCTSIHWIPSQHKTISPKKGKKSKSYLSENYLLAVGTAKGDILLYNVSSKNLYLHLVARHSDAVNDMFFYSESNSFFTCSNDQSIAIWDITTGKQKSKWKTDGNPVSSICVIDDNNMLSSNTSILWWNISEKSIIKKFTGHSTEIFKLLPVNAVLLTSCYFLSAAVSDFKINAWSLNSNECQSPVASFVLPDEPEDIDISNVSSKDKPLILSTVTKNGFLHLFEHILNGNLNQPIQPKASIEINSESPSASIISTKLSPDSESCIVAYGSSKSSMIFKHIKIKDAFKENEVQNTSLNKKRPVDVLTEVKETSKSAKSVPINGIKSTPTAGNNPKVARLKDADEVISNYRRRLGSSSNLSLTELETNTCESEESISAKSRNSVKVVDIKDPINCTDILLRGLHTQDEDVLNTIFKNSDSEFISAVVKSLPKSSLKSILTELSQRLHNHLNYSPTISKWLKEILKVHLNYLIQSQDTAEILNYIKKQIYSMKISETICKLSVLKGFLNLQIQSSSSEESDSEYEESMEL